MKKFINKFNIVLIIAFLSTSACTKEDYSFGDLSSPAELTLQAVIQGVNAANVNGDGTGKVSITLASSNTINYNVNFEKEVLTTKANAWETLTFDYSAISSVALYHNLVFIFDNGTAGDGSANFTFYFDDITLN